MMWKYDGSSRPPFAEDVAPGEQSVWDFPRPPAIERYSQRIRVRIDGVDVADTRQAIAVLETASAPGIYIPPADVDSDLLRENEIRTYCEWKGAASYYDLSVARNILPCVGWTYHTPTSRFADIVDYVSFYPARVECYVEGERVHPQAGGFYGGWVTANLAGPIKGAPGSGWW